MIPLFATHHQLIRITPSPLLPWLDRPDDGMAGRAKMFRGVLVLGGVAAPDVPASQAHPQMDPAVIHLQALLAACSARFDIADLVEMGAVCLRHYRTK